MKRMLESIDNNQQQSVDRFIVFLFYYFFLTIIIGSLDTTGLFSSIFNYLNTFILIILSILICRSNKYVLTINYLGLAGLICYISSILFTSMHVGISSALFTMAKEFPLIFYFVFLSTYKMSYKSFLHSLKILIGFCFFSILYAVLFQDMVPVLLNMNNAYAVDIHSFFYGKNQFGRLLYLGSVSAFTIFCIERNIGKKSKFYFLTFIILAFFTVLSLSRAALLALFVFLISFFIFSSGGKLTRNVFILLIALFFLIIVSLNSDLVSYLDRFIFRSNVGLSSRDVVWNIALSYIQEHPLIGSGEYMAEAIIHAGGVDLSEFHNQFLYRMVANGLPIFVLYVSIFLKIAGLLFRKIRRSPLYCCSLAVFISLLVYMLFEQFTIFHFSLDALVFLVFILFVPDDFPTELNEKHV